MREASPAPPETGLPMTRTAFYGGSFNPPHLAHLAVARAALASGRTDRVLFVPAFVPPHKPGRRIAPFEDRCRMVELLIEGESGMELSDFEGRLRLRPSYTINVLKALRHERPGEILQLLIGGDSLRNLHLWHRGKELAESYEILTYPREGETPELHELLRNWTPDLAEKLAAGILDGVFFKISSTNIRNRLENSTGAHHINNEVPRRILEYARKRKLYSREKENMTDSPKKIDPAELADFCLKCAEEKLAENAIKIALGASSSIADYLVICTAKSEPQLNALHSFIERQVREVYQKRPLSESHVSSSGWMLIDFGTVVVHIMTPETRDRYNLEGLWGETPSAEAVRNLEARHP